MSVCKNKWTSLRNSYARELRELRNKKSGSGGSKKRKWYLFESMSFLSNFMLQHKQMTSNVNDNSDEPDERCESEEYLNDTAIVEGNTSLEDSTVSTPCEQPLTDAVFKTPKKSKIKLKTASEKVAQPMIEFLKSRTKIASVEDSSEILFFKSLIPDIKKLNENNQRRFKQVVLSTLNNFIDEQEQKNQEQMTSFPNRQDLYSLQVIQDGGQNMNTYYNTFSSDVASPMTDSSSSYD